MRRVPRDLMAALIWDACALIWFINAAVSGSFMHMAVGAIAMVNAVKMYDLYKIEQVYGERPY